MKLVNVKYLDGDYAETGFLAGETSWSFLIRYDDGSTETFEKSKYKYELIG